MKLNLLRVQMWMLLLFVFCTPNWSDTKIFSVVAACSLAHTHRHFRVPATTTIIKRDGGGMFLSDNVTYLPAYSGWTKVTSKIIITTLRTSDLILYDIQQVLDISAKIWLIWDCKFRYLISVCVSSLTVSESVTKSEGVIVCLRLGSELLTAVTCLPCWDVTPCSLICVRTVTRHKETKHNS